MSDHDLPRALANAQSLGWVPVPSRHVTGRQGYLSATDEQRAADLDDAIRDASIDAIWCARGGYGVMRILDMIDYDALRASPKAIIGYSDITALHLAIAERCGITTYHGPNARSALTSFSRASLSSAVGAAGERSSACGTAASARTLRDGRATGILTGGNLALVCALVGTPFAARMEGAIVILEDVNEPVYRIDRLLQQLRLSGSLEGASGIIFGAFTDRGDDPDSERLEALFRETADAIGVPCLVDAPVGHIDDQWTLPMGARAELDAGARTLKILADP